MHAQVCDTHANARMRARKDTYACSKKRAKPCKSPDVQDDTGEDEKVGGDGDWQEEWSAWKEGRGGGVTEEGRV